MLHWLYFVDHRINARMVPDVWEIRVGFEDEPPNQKGKKTKG